ncbi:phage Gp37/Gp68 family protein [Pseudodesulfovibrio pelocollis]|uniref:phage Gp37/Gp68 family protein n=1 Tax=Pseudodesulfovibrio pelocollis TaxID=3051432 RepID=UPI00255B1A80|nr:phage Gp37/Gp68 family protein [Pseudodesulfovibrio sp. SB368]
MPTKIEWTDERWNPIIGCSKISPACDNCYAERMACRLATMPATAASYGQVVDLSTRAWNGTTALVESALATPLSWRKPRRVFVGSMTDLFHPTVPDEWLDCVFAVMAITPHITYQILTKRPERMREYLSEGTDPYITERWCNAAIEMKIDDMEDDWDKFPLPNIWLGVTAEDQPRAEERIPILINTPAAVRYVSYEPGLGAVDLDRLQEEGATYHALSGSVGVEGRGQAPYRKLDWVICGGESGPGARPMHPDWARRLRDQCQEAGVSIFFKQWGEWFVPEDGARACRVCGCTEHNACDERCWWVEEDLCSSCVGKPAPAGDRPVKFRRIGKKAAGRKLDGREWNEFPNNS